MRIASRRFLTKAASKNVFLSASSRGSEHKYAKLFKNSGFKGFHCFKSLTSFVVILQLILNFYYKFKYLGFNLISNCADYGHFLRLP